MRSLLLLCLMGIGSSLAALSLEDLIPGHAAALLRGERPLVSQFRNPQPRLLPQNEALAKLHEDIHQDLDPNVMVETLHLYSKPPEANKTAWSSEEKAALYNGVLALSSLAGIEYFSASRGVMRILYETSTIIDSPNGRRPIPDPTFAQPQEELTVFARQKDLTFGDNIYQYDFYSTNEAIIFIQQNLTPLNTGIVPAVGRNRLRSIVAILDAGDYLLVYAASMARAVSIPGINERVGVSFANRAEAIVNWFTAQADEAFSLLRCASSQAPP